MQICCTISVPVLFCNHRIFANGGGAGYLTTNAPQTKTLIIIHTQLRYWCTAHSYREGAAVVSVYIGAWLC